MAFLSTRRRALAGFAGLAGVVLTALVVLVPAAQSASHGRARGLRRDTPRLAFASKRTQTGTAVNQVRKRAVDESGLLQRQAAAVFAVFGTRPTAGDSLPAASAYANGVARQIGIPSAQLSAWAVLKDGQVCVTVSGSGAAAGGPAACNSLSTLAEPGQLLTLEAGEGPAGSSAAAQTAVYQVVAGLVPNGVTSVGVHYSDGSSASVPVTNNGFAMLTGGKTPTEFIWSSSGGTTESESSGLS